MGALRRRPSAGFGELGGGFGYRVGRSRPAHQGLNLLNPQALVQMAARTGEDIPRVREDGRGASGATPGPAISTGAARGDTVCAATFPPPVPSMPARHPLRRIAAAALLLVAASVASAWRSQTPRVLVFSKTAGFRHASIGAGVAAVKKLGQDNGFAVDATEDAGAFTDRTLRRYRAVVFLSTTGDVLDARQQDALERYVQAGGGWVGVHSAADTEYDWPWYGRLAGAYFASHPNDPNVRRATFRVRDTTHAATAGLPARWEREDEFYNFRNVRPDLRVLVDVDETTYQGGTNGADHPMAWYHAFDGGRAFYTAMGHTEASFAEAPFLRHLLALPSHIVRGLGPLYAGRGGGALREATMGQR